MSALRWTAVLVIIPLLVPCLGGDAAYINTASIFELGGSVRAIGMGGAFLAVSDDIAAVFYNPSGLPKLESASLSSLFTRPFGSYSFGSLGVAESGWGAKLLLLDSGRLEKRDLYGNPTGTFRLTETGWLVAGGLRVGGGVSVGLQGKLHALALPTRGMGVSLSPAISYREGPRTYAMVWRNLLNREISFASGHTEPWIRNLAVGFSWSVGTTLLAFDFTEQLITRADLSCLRVGAENTQFHPLVLRAGTHREGSSFGASVYWEDFRFDVAYVLHYKLPDSYYAALVYSWDAPLTEVLMRSARWLVDLFR